MISQEYVAAIAASCVAVASLVISIRSRIESRKTAAQAVEANRALCRKIACEASDLGLSRDTARRVFEGVFKKPTAEQRQYFDDAWMAARMDLVIKSVKQ